MKEEMKAIKKYDLSVKTDLTKFMSQYYDDKLFEPTDSQKVLWEALNKNKKLELLRASHPRRQYYFSYDPGTKEGDKGCTVIYHKEAKKNGKQCDLIIIDDIDNHT